MSDIDTAFMRRCFALAEQGRQTARPNPVVGCVIVAQGTVVGEGWHAVAGQPHAEVHALRQAGAQARGATAYVSLEPCVHQGRTGPCCDALIAAGISQVVYGQEDPNPLVAGKGLARLRAAGVSVSGPLLPDEAEALNPGFCKRMRGGLPWVRCKVAMSLDARTAMASGESQWITGAAAREDVQYWRARSCAVLSGSGTVLADDPALTVRLADFAGHQPLRVICDSTLCTPPGARLLQQPGAVLLVCAHADEGKLAALRAAAAATVQLDSLPVPSADGKVDLLALLQHLARQRQCNEVLVEAGATLGGALLQAGLIDELLLYVAPMLLGSEACPLFDLRGLLQLSDAWQLEFSDVAMVGKDCRMRTRVVKGE